MDSKWLYFENFVITVRGELQQWQVGCWCRFGGKYVATMIQVMTRQQPSCGILNYYHNCVALELFTESLSFCSKYLICIIPNWSQSALSCSLAVSVTITKGIIWLHRDTHWWYWCLFINADFLLEYWMQDYCKWLYLGCMFILKLNKTFPFPFLSSSDDDIFLPNFEIFRMSCEQTEQTKSELDSCLFRKLNCVSQNRNVLTQLIWRKIRRIHEENIVKTSPRVWDIKLRSVFVTWQEKSTISLRIPVSN